MQTFPASLSPSNTHTFKISRLQRRISRIIGHSKCVYSVYSSSLRRQTGRIHDFHILKIIPQQCPEIISFPLKRIGSGLGKSIAVPDSFARHADPALLAFKGIAGGRQPQRLLALLACICFLSHLDLAHIPGPIAFHTLDFLQKSGCGHRRTVRNLIDLSGK